MSTTNLVCIDWKDSREDEIDGHWQKDWGTVLCNVKVMTIDEFMGGCACKVVLVLVHESAVRKVTSSDEQFLRRLDDIRLIAAKCGACVGVVSAGRLCNATVVSEDGRYCVLSTPFPRHLVALKTRIDQLIADLDSGKGDCAKFRDAWICFDTSSSFEYITALSILCQGFLAGYALNNISNGGVNMNGCDDVGKALYAMGLVDDATAEKVSQTAIDLDLDSTQPMPGIEFWTTPFEGGKPLRAGLEGECSKGESTLPDSIKALVKRVEDKNCSDGEFVCVVARAYFALNELLEKA